MWVGAVAGFVMLPLLVCGFARLAANLFPDTHADAHQTAALLAARNLVEALDEFCKTHERMPAAGEGLAALAPRYADAPPTDPWNNPFVYRASPRRQWADVLSYGADGKPGGKGVAGDVSGRYGILGSHSPAALNAAAAAVFFSLPLLGLIGARRRDWAAGLLAGASAVCALLLFALLSTTLRALSLSSVLPAVVALSCLTGSAALFQRAAGARFLTIAAISAAALVIADLIGA